MALTPYSGPFGRPELTHLLRRTLFGVTPADLAHFDGMSLTQVVDELLTFTNNTAPPIKAYSLNLDPNAVDPDVPFGQTWVNTPRATGLFPDPISYRRISLAEWLMGLMVGQERNLREKMGVFWQTNLTTQASVVQLPEPLYGYNQLLRDQCLGNFRQLMYDVTVHPCMLIYLNGYLNNVLAPDENYGRELMELFTLGEGTGYTESDVQQAARVLTGWTVLFANGGNPIIPITSYVPFLHSTADKTFSAFFNNTVIQAQGGANGGALELNALLDMIFAKDEVSLHICRKLYRFFVHGDIDPTVESDVIVPLAETFRNNGGAADQLRIVMRELLLSAHFFSSDVRACMVSNPVDFAVGTLRMFGMPFPDATQFEAQYKVWGDLYGVVAYAGQTLGDPPAVAGWPAYYQYPLYDEMWLDSATYAVRKQIYEGVSYVGLSTPATMVQPQSQSLALKIDFVQFVQQFTDAGDPNALIDEACKFLFAVDVSQSVKDTLKTNYLLFGQTTDSYWTNAYNTYVADPNTTDPAAQLVPFLLLGLFIDMQGAAEHHLI
ncbi:MAG: DUF1800 domain-containing protein [Flavobacteriales bacterium]|nr:DUF1800 domain-containing protein [Flavobacteriales bacterium]MCB9166258.1 DUF1800 domain-containing protein [Flavobacteriales bacterium]